MTAHNVAMVGCGGVTSMHFAGYAAHPDRVRVVAGCDPVEERRQWARDAHGVERTCASIDELLGWDGWDVAVVCTPSDVREPALRALAAAGKHIFVEKPMADTYDEALRLVTLCADAGVLLAVDQNFRDHYPFLSARGLIEDGAIGDVHTIAHQDLMFRQDQGWRMQQVRHALSVMGVHWLDGFRQLLGKEAVEVICHTSSSPAIDCQGETDAVVHIDFPTAAVSYVQSFSSAITRTETLVFGTTGTLRLGYDATTLSRRGEDDKTWANPYRGAQKPESAYANLARLLDAIDAGGEPANSGVDNLKTIALLDAAYESARTRRPAGLPA